MRQTGACRHYRMTHGVIRLPVDNLVDRNSCKKILEGFLEVTSMIRFSVIVTVGDRCACDVAEIYGQPLQAHACRSHYGGRQRY